MSSDACPRWHALQTRRVWQIKYQFFFCTVLELYCRWCQQQPHQDLLLRPGLVSSPRANVGLCFHTYSHTIMNL